MKTVDEILATLSFITIGIILRGSEYEEKEQDDEGKELPEMGCGKVIRRSQQYHQANHRP